MHVLHAAVLAQRQAPASRLQLFGALVRLFARLQAFGRRFVCLGHGAVTGDVLFDFFFAVLGKGAPGQAHGEYKKSNGFHGFHGFHGFLGFLG
jgi:hypothetical protein